MSNRLTHLLFALLGLSLTLHTDLWWIAGSQAGDDVTHAQAAIDAAAGGDSILVHPAEPLGQRALFARGSPSQPEPGRARPS